MGDVDSCDRQLGLQVNGTRPESQGCTREPYADSRQCEMPEIKNKTKFADAIHVLQLFNHLSTGEKLDKKTGKISRETKYYNKSSWF